MNRKQEEHDIYAIMKTKCPPGYCHKSFVATHALGHIMYSYTLLVPRRQRLLKKLSKERNLSDHKSSTTHRVLTSHESKMGVIYMQS